MGCTCSTGNAAEAQNKARDLAMKVGALRDGQKLDMRAIVMLMWKARENHQIVEVLSELVSTHADEKDVFDGIEFYLPQLVHMILHLEIQWKTSFLEQFALMISQQSLHLALQMYWILVASMQDYQPENDEGLPNPTSNPELFIRCATLQNNLERSVVFGSPHCSDLEHQYAAGILTKDQLQDKEIEDRKLAARQFIEEGKKSLESVVEGVLWYKRWNRTSRYAPKGWTKRKFRVQNRVLICYSEDGKRMIRAIPLVHTQTLSVDHYKFQNYFEVREQKRERVWKMRAESPEEMKKWMDCLQKEASAPPPLIANPSQKLTETQIARYGFYRSERDFVRDITDICEDLRFVPVPERKPKLRAHLEQLDIPGCVYLPMCKSTAPWYRVVKVLPEKGHPFSTRARCPCLMTFEVVGDGDVDLANYLYQTLDQGSGLTSEGRRTFIKSAKLSAVVGNNLSSSGTKTTGADTVDDSSRLQIAFSDAQEPQTVEHSLWAQELKPSATSSKHATMFSSEARRKLHVDLGNQALSLIQKAAEDLKVVLEIPSAAASPHSEHSVEQPLNSVSRAMAMANADDGRTASVRIKSIAERTNPSTPKLDRIIAKSNDDLRQEVFTMQCMQFLQDTWEGLPLYVRTYRILSTSSSTGILECITNADSIDGIKKDQIKAHGKPLRFIEKFKELFPAEVDFKAAQKRYMESLAGSCLVCYILRIGDRHNGNIMLELETGRLAHIDFGFVFGMRPGKDKVPYTDFSFERAPFKLTSEMVEILGGKGSPLWKEFIQAMVDGFLAIRKQADVLLTLVEICGYRSMFPCFNQPGGGVQRVLRELRQRLMLNVPDSAIPKKIEALANKSYQHLGTILYERFQLQSNKIQPIF
jgi:hypothetical protein